MEYWLLAGHLPGQLELALDQLRLCGLEPVVEILALQHQLLRVPLNIILSCTLDPIEFNTVILAYISCAIGENKV